MPYAYITLGQAKQALAQRLYEFNVAPGPYQFWPQAELGVYINEALQEFNVTANFYRQEFQFPLAANTTWYDLTTQPGSLRPMTSTDQQLLSIIEYHFLEPQTSSYPLTWTGTKQFAITDLLNAIQQMRDQTVSESTCTVLESLVPAVPGRIFLADTAMDLRRVCWIPVLVTNPTYTPNVVLDSDIWATQSYDGIFNISFPGSFPQAYQGIPQIYRRSTEPPLSFDVDTIPAVNGQYDILTTNNGPNLSINASTVFEVPNDWAWVIKYGAMAQLFSRVDLAYDPVRSSYCWARYKQAVAMMAEAPAALAARINDVPVIIDAMSNGDFYDANWQGKPPGRPQYLYYSGLNMTAVSPIPDQLYSMTASVIANMPLPVLDVDFLQIGRDDVSPVLDEAQHIAMIKAGGQEFAQTYALHTNFLRHCLLYNSKLKALSHWLHFIDERAQEEIRVNPVFDKPEVKEVAGGG
jgi:hypothetical protein